MRKWWPQKSPQSNGRTPNDLVMADDHVCYLLMLQKSGDQPVDMKNVQFFDRVLIDNRWLFGISEPSTLLRYTHMIVSDHQQFHCFFFSHVASMKITATGGHFFRGTYFGGNSNNANMW